MRSLAVVLAQCTGPLDECDLPRTLPWYFGLAIAALWLAAVVGVVLLVRRKWITRRRARRTRRGRLRRAPDETAADVELW